MKFEPALLDEIRRSLPISQVVGEHVIWDKRKSQPGRGDFWACCPFHGEKTPSFHADDRKGMYHCFGCGKTGDHYKFLTECAGMTFPEAVEHVASMAGVSLPSAPHRSESEDERRARETRLAADRERHEAERRAAELAQAAARAERTMDAKQAWQQSQPLVASLGDRYLQGRGLPPIAEWPWDCKAVLRFHPSLDYELDRSAGRWPAILCRVVDAWGEGIAIWQIYVARDGNGKAPLPNAKVGRGPAGGGAVRFGGDAPSIGIAEGLETSIAAWFLIGNKKPVWPCLSTSGMSGFEPPDFVRQIEVFPDGDRAKPHDKDGRMQVGERPGMMAAKKLKTRVGPIFGKDFSIAPEPLAGSDYLDVYNEMKAKGLL